MDKITYEKILEYCTKKYGRILVPVERDFVIRSFLESYYQAIEAHKKAHNGMEPNEDELATIINTLTSDTTLHSYAYSAQTYYEKLTSTIESSFEKKMGKFEFLKTLGTNLLSSLAYSFLLIFIFWIAKDQIATWLLQLIG